MYRKGNRWERRQIIGKGREAEGLVKRRGKEVDGYGSEMEAKRKG